MDVIAAYREVGSYRGAAAICGTTHKTVKRIVERHEAGRCGAGARRTVATTTTRWPSWSRRRSRRRTGRISAKRLLPAARTAGYAGSARNFRRLVADAESGCGGRAITAVGGRRSGRRATRWSSTGACWTGCTCSARCWPGRGCGSCASPTTRGADTTLAMLAECFEALGGVPKIVLADRMGCLKAGVVANVVVPTADYVRFATHYGFRPDFCQAADPESKGIVENLVGYAKTRPDGPASSRRLGPGARRTRRPAAWCAEVNAAAHSEICAVPAERLEHGAGAAGGVAVAAARDRAASRSPARSTSCPASGSARPATRCRTG